MNASVDNSSSALDCVSVADSCRRSGNYWNECHAALEQFGVTSICHLTLPFEHEARIRGLSAACLFRTSYPKQWHETVGGNPFDHDMSVQLLVAGSELVFWHQLRASEKFSETQQRLNEAELDLGMNIGISLVSRKIHNAGGITGVGLCFADMKPEQFDPLWAEHSPSILQLAHLLDAGLIENGLQEIIHLSPRERDMLCYLAAGYRTDDIANKLHRSPKTLEKYINSAKLKLKAPTRDNAVAKALVLGLLTA